MQTDSSDSPLTPPASLALPFALQIDRLEVGGAQLDGLALRGQASLAHDRRQTVLSLSEKVAGTSQF